MSELPPLPERLRAWADYCHEHNIKAELQRDLLLAADEIESLLEELEVGEQEA